MQKLMGAMRKAIQDYGMLSDGDRVAVGVSGGKDSLALLAGLAGLRDYIGIDYRVVGITIDMGNPKVPTPDWGRVEAFCRALGVEYQVKRTEIGDIIFNVRQEKNPCSLCARMRRGYLYSQAQKLGCNKIALGHHFDDVIETILMSILYGGEVRSMMPKLHSTNFAGMQLIRPLYYVKEKDITAWAAYNGLEFIRCACRFTEHVASGLTESKRFEVKKLIEEMKKTNENVEYNLFKSVYNVNLDTMIGYKSDGKRHHFMDDYID